MRVELMKPREPRRGARVPEQSGERTFRSPRSRLAFRTSVGDRSCFHRRVRPIKRNRRKEIFLTQVGRSILGPMLRYICFSKRTAISRFGFFVFEIIQLPAKPPPRCHRTYTGSGWKDTRCTQSHICQKKGEAHLQVCQNKPRRRRYRSAEGRSVARRAKQLILLPLPLPLFFFCHFLPRNRMSSPQST